MYCGHSSSPLRKNCQPTAENGKHLSSPTAHFFQSTAEFHGCDGTKVRERLIPREFRWQTAKWNSARTYISSRVRESMGYCHTFQPASNLGFPSLGHRTSATRVAVPQNSIEFGSWVGVRSWLEMRFSKLCRKTLNISYLGGIGSSRLRVGSSNRLRVHGGKILPTNCGKIDGDPRFCSRRPSDRPFPANCGKAPDKVNLLI